MRNTTTLAPRGYYLMPCGWEGGRELTRAAAVNRLAGRPGVVYGLSKNVGGPISEWAWQYRPDSNEVTAEWTVCAS